MSEAEHLEAIRAAPDDDGPRLVYADWLLMQNDPRGELIQLQCRLAAEELTNAARRKMRIAENKLLAEYEKKAVADIATLLGVANDGQLVKAELRRGFIHRIKAPAIILRRLDEIAALAPLVENLDVRPNLPYDQPTRLAPEDFDAVSFERIRTLRFSLGEVDSRSLESVARAPRLANVRDLAIEGMRWTAEPEAGVRIASALTSSPHLKLERLSVDDSWFGNAGVRTLFGNRWSLKALSIAGCSCDGAIFEAIAGAPALSSLERLSVRLTQPVNARQIAMLASAKNLGRLVALDLEQCELRAEGLRAFVDAFKLPALEELIIAGNHLGEAGGLVLAAATKLEQLRLLDLTKNQIGRKGVVALSKAPQFANLQKLLLHERESKDARAALEAWATLAKTQIYFRGHLVAKTKPPKARARLQR